MFLKLIDVKGINNCCFELKYEHETQGIADIVHLAHRGIFK
jgi:hypothetical protein